MPDINDLRQARAAELEKVQALAALEAEGTELSAEQLDEFTVAQTAFEKLDAQVKRAESAEKMAAAAAVPVPGIGANSGFGPDLKEEPKPGARMARMMQCIGAIGHGGREAANYADTVLKDGEVAAALNTGTPAAGGVLVPQAFIGEVIELLTPRAVVRSFDPVIWPMPNGNATVPRIVNGAMSNYVGENIDIPASEQTFGDLQLRAKKLTTLVPTSNDLLRYEGINQQLERVLINDMLNSMSLREDLAFIRGDGAADTPKGLRHLAPVSNVIVASDGSSIDKIDTDLGKLKLALTMANVNMLEPGWIFSPRTLEFLMSRRDGNNNKVYPELMKGRLGLYPYKTTTQIPVNLGGTGSEIYLADFTNVVIGDALDVTVALSSEASYIDPASGQLVSAFSRDQSVMRIVSAHDFGMRHAASVAVLTDVNWGA